MNLVVVGIGDCRISGDPADVLVTYALGSCVCITIYDAIAKVGGLLHILLPESAVDPIKARQQPFMFADTGIPLLFHGAYALGARKDRLVTRIAGGSQMNAMCSFLDVGLKNVEATRLTLRRNGVKVVSEAVGGKSARTVRLDIATGEMFLQETHSDPRKIAHVPTGVSRVR